MSITITTIIIAFTVLVSWRAWQDPGMMNKLVYSPAAVKERGEYYRFVSAGFVHRDGMHLFFNMYALYIFGAAGEFTFSSMLGTTFGNVGFLLFYLAGIVAAKIVTYVRHQDNYGFSSIGASGGVSAVMWPFIMIAPWSWFIFPPLPAILLGIGYIFYSDYQDRRGGGTTNHNAHLWGAIFGLVVYVALIIVFNEPRDFLQEFIVKVSQPQGPDFF
ncbi:rhomboid family intramembrane serine protease [Neolewinella antarctica]|uniref:Membrane associated rhomboid family serine protease n=1 Tax=Neolewinella antarctica TaxID=442734 RepID=A0ABX0X6Y0_9BACT|nr:rhomboid family intramembrane serine protease [Neolewinella antarctica]NJC24970.1 membrane associated rhomboid family serine protease [Neolewinella antarctica]